MNGRIGLGTVPALAWPWLALVCGGGAFAFHVVRYFYLADDFALVAEAGRFPPSSAYLVYGEALFSVYRPHIFAVASVLHPLLGFDVPWAWAALVLACHTGNAWLLRILARQVGCTPDAAYASAAVFWLSPWALEAPLWLSGLFDVLAVNGVLVALYGATVLGREEPHWRCGVLLVVAGSIVALPSKENTFVLPALVAIVTLLAGEVSPPPPWLGRRRLVTAVGAAVVSLVVVAVYLWMRGQIVPGDSTYSPQSYARQILSVDSLAASVQTLRALVVWPTGALDEPWASAYRLMRFPTAHIALPILIVGLIGRQPRLAMLCAALAAFTLLPTAFIAIGVETITPRRYLYLAGIPTALVIGAATAPLLRSTRLSAHLSLALLSVTVAVSVVGQVALWAHATAVSRCALVAFDRTPKTPGQPIAVPESPRLLGLGPWIVTSYAYRFYARETWHWGREHVTDGYLHLVDGRPTLVARDAPATLAEPFTTVSMCGCFEGASCATR